MKQSSSIICYFKKRNLIINRKVKIVLRKRFGDDHPNDNNDKFIAKLDLMLTKKY